MAQSQAAKQKKEKAKRNFSPETREKLSQLAKERHRRGELGGPEFGKMGGRGRKKNRAAERVAEAAQQDANARAMIQTLKDATDPSQPIGVRLRGTELWLNIEREEGKLALQEEEADAKQHSREELLEILASKLTSGPAAQILRRQLEGESGITDAEVVDVDGEEIADGDDAEAASS